MFDYIDIEKQKGFAIWPVSCGFQPQPNPIGFHLFSSDLHEKSPLIASISQCRDPGWLDGYSLCRAGMQERPANNAFDIYRHKDPVPCRFHRRTNGSLETGERERADPFELLLVLFDAE